MNTYVYVKRGKRSSMCFISSRIKMRVKSGNNTRWIAIKNNKYSLQFIFNLPLDDYIVLDKLHRYNGYINSSYKIGDMSYMKINTK